MLLTNTMVWHDPDTQFPLGWRVERAINGYEKRHGRPPTTVLLHESEGIEPVEVSGVQVRPAANIMQFHFTMGMESR